MNKVTVKYWRSKSSNKVAVAIYSSRAFEQGYCFLTCHGKMVTNMNGGQDWFDTLQSAKDATKKHTRLRNLCVISSEIVDC